MTKVVALAGGSGSAKLLRGLATLGADLSVVANVGDNFTFIGLRVCPDVDIATYALAGILDREKGWGISGDTFESIGQISRLGGPSWFNLGDRDMAVSIIRTSMMNDGSRLTAVADTVRRSLGVPNEILPVTDDPLETWVGTPGGVLHLQEYWVRERGTPPVQEVFYRGVDKAKATDEVIRAISSADRIVLCPANPVSSIGPIIAVDGVREALKGTKAKVVAVSPMTGKSPFSGPAGKFMAAKGIRGDSLGVALAYGGFLDALLVHTTDADLSKEIKAAGVEVAVLDTRLAAPDDEKRVAQAALEA